MVQAIKLAHPAVEAWQKPQLRMKNYTKFDAVRIPTWEQVGTSPIVAKALSRTHGASLKLMEFATLIRILSRQATFVVV